MGEGGLGEGAPEEERESPRGSWEGSVLPLAFSMHPRRTSCVLELIRRTRAPDIAPDLVLHAADLPHPVLTRCAQSCVRPSLLPVWGPPTPARWASLLVPSLSLKPLSAGWTSLLTSFLRVYLPPVSVYQWVSPAAPLRCKDQSPRGKVTELLQGGPRVA